MKSTNPADKVEITLGQLYRRMSNEFRAVRPEDHRACIMPMVVPSQGDEGANWTLEPLTSFCSFCSALTGMIAAEHALRYQVRFFPEIPARSGPETLLDPYLCPTD